jgi:hypothetical protein
LSSSLFSNNELKNLLTLSHLLQHEHEVDDHSHTHTSSHSHGKENAHHNTIHEEKDSKRGLFKVAHRHHSDTDKKDEEPHEHHLSFFPSLVAFISEPLEAEQILIEKTEPSQVAPDQLISNPHLNRLFRPPIS